MRPGQLHPNEFEIALLNRVLLEHPDADFAISALHVISRKFTGVGSFTEFLVKGRAPLLDRRVPGTSAIVAIPGLQFGLRVVAFLEGDRPNVGDLLLRQ